MKQSYCRYMDGSTLYRDWRYKCRVLCLWSTATADTWMGSILYRMIVDTVHLCWVDFLVLVLSIVIADTRMSSTLNGVQSLQKHECRAVCLWSMVTADTGMLSSLFMNDSYCRSRNEEHCFWSMATADTGMPRPLCNVLSLQTISTTICFQLQFWYIFPLKKHFMLCTLY